MHAEDLILNCASIIKWKFATSTSEGTNGKHLLYLHDDRESSKRLYSALKQFLWLSIWFNLIGCLQSLHAPENTLKLQLDAPHVSRDTL